MEIDNYYWFFSAAAQSIAALIAFLMAGVALAFSMMDRLVDQDDTLYEVVESLRRQQHKEMATLAIFTGVAIVTSLSAIYLNPWDTKIRSGLIVFSVFIDFAVISGAIYFVITIVMPSRYSVAAQKEYAEAKEEIIELPGQEAVSVFFKEFIELERSIREYLKFHDLYVPSRGAPKMSYSFRQMVDGLFQNERISKNLRDQLLNVNKFRNLLFHGHIDQVDQGVIKSLKDAHDSWNIEKNKDS